MNDAFALSILYRALRLHFTQDSYDFVKFQGQVSGNNLLAQQKFNNSKQKFLFTSLGKHKDPKNLIISNLIYNNKSFILDITSEKGYNTFNEWENRQAQLYYNLSQDLNKFEYIKELTSISRSSLPILIEKYISEDISSESVVLIDSVIHKLDDWQKIKHPLIENNILKLRKYRSFYSPDIEKIKRIFLKKWS